MAENNTVQKQFEFVSAAKRSLAMHLCQCSSFLAVASNVKQNVKSYNQSAVYEFHVRVSPRNSSNGNEADLDDPRNGV